MIKRISENEFIEIMQADPYSDYTTEAWRMIYQFLETGHDVELDVPYIRGRFEESPVYQIIEDHNIQIDYDALDEDDINKYNKINQVIDQLEKKTCVLGLTCDESNHLVYLSY